MGLIDITLANLRIQQDREFGLRCQSVRRAFRPSERVESIRDRIARWVKAHRPWNAPGSVLQVALHGKK